jgi:redox-sensitive bicupin YhaK (pirin superfamily)
VKFTLKHVASSREADFETKPTIEGAGVKLQRAFGFGKTAEFDPFLLLDDFRSDNPADYVAGFPWHPHRGIETITYVLAGEVAHGDSLGNKGRMTAGDVQWMTAGSGILHQEMPKGDEQGRMHGFQLWANLPAALKMTDPRYQDIPASAIPEVTEDDGTKARIICGEFWGKKGPVEGVAADPRYVDISVPPGKRKRIQVETTRNAFAYVFAGAGTFRDASTPQAVLTESAVDPNARRSTTRRTTRWCCSTAATRSWCRPARRAFASCWSQASRWKSRWPGTGRS